MRFSRFKSTNSIIISLFFSFSSMAHTPFIQAPLCVNLLNPVEYKANPYLHVSQKLLLDAWLPSNAISDDDLNYHMDRGLSIEGIMNQFNTNQFMNGVGSIQVAPKKWSIVDFKNTSNSLDSFFTSTLITLLASPADQFLVLPKEVTKYAVDLIKKNGINSDDSLLVVHKLHKINEALLFYSYLPNSLPNGREALDLTRVLLSNLPQKISTSDLIIRILVFRTTFILNGMREYKIQVAPSGRWSMLPFFETILVDYDVQNQILSSYNSIFAQFTPGTSEITLDQLRVKLDHLLKVLRLNQIIFENIPEQPLP